MDLRGRPAASGNLGLFKTMLCCGKLKNTPRQILCLTNDIVLRDFEKWDPDKS